MASTRHDEISAACLPYKDAILLVQDAFLFRRPLGTASLWLIAYVAYRFLLSDRTFVFKMASSCIMLILVNRLRPLSHLFNHKAKPLPDAFHTIPNLLPARSFSELCATASYLENHVLNIMTTCKAMHVASPGQLATLSSIFFLLLAFIFETVSPDVTTGTAFLVLLLGPIVERHDHLRRFASKVFFQLSRVLSRIVDLTGGFFENLPEKMIIVAPSDEAAAESLTSSMVRTDVSSVISHATQIDSAPISPNVSANPSTLEPPRSRGWSLLNEEDKNQKVERLMFQALHED